MSASKTIGDIRTVQRSNCCSWRPRLVLLMATLSYWASSCSMAEASCGDYLHKRGKPVSSHVMFDSLNFNSVTWDGADAGSTSAPLSAPCTGPNCSRSPRPAAPAQVPTTIISEFEQAVLNVCETNSSLDQLRRRIPDSERSTPYEPMEIFRPPTRS